MDHMRCDLDIDEVKNMWPGFPPRPATGGGLPGALGDKYNGEAKADGDRVLLIHGFAFNRKGGVYTRDPDEYLKGHWLTLTDLFDCKLFDLEYFPHGINAGKAMLIDLMRYPEGIVARNEFPSHQHADYHARRGSMEAMLPQANPAKETVELDNDLFISPSISGDKVDEFYEGLKTSWEITNATDGGWRDAEQWIWEGVVMKRIDHHYRTTARQSSNKGEWIKYRFR